MGMLIPYHCMQGLAKYVEWSANMMEEDAKRRLKAAELQAKKTRLKFWTNYVPPPTNSKAIHDQNFTGKVVVYARYTCVICFLSFITMFYLCMYS